MLKKIALGIVALVALLAIVIALQPSEFRVVRSAAMAAPTAEVFAQVNDLQAWRDWSPWEEVDPAMTRTFEGPSAGTGAVYKWSGNDDVGAGAMTITESRPNELVRILLAFTRPMESECDTEFTFKPDGEQTVVTWTMSGRNNFIGKAFCLFVDMDEMCGSQFEQGLAAMKAIAEASPAKTDPAESPSAEEAPQVSQR